MVRLPQFFLMETKLAAASDNRHHVFIPTGATVSATLMNKTISRKRPQREMTFGWSTILSHCCHVSTSYWPALQPCSLTLTCLPSAFFYLPFLPGSICSRYKLLPWLRCAGSHVISMRQGSSPRRLAREWAWRQVWQHFRAHMSSLG